MLATTPAGDAYTCAELERISKSAGFARVELAPPEISFCIGRLACSDWNLLKITVSEAIGQVSVFSMNGSTSG